MSRLAELESLLDQDPDDPFIIYALAREYEKNQVTMQALLMYELLINDQIVGGIFNPRVKNCHLFARSVLCEAVVSQRLIFLIRQTKFRRIKEPEWSRPEIQMK